MNKRRKSAAEFKSQGIPHLLSGERSMASDTTQENRRGCLFYVARGLLAWMLLIVVLAVGGVVYQMVATRADQQAYPPPGQLVDVGGSSLHLYCTGEGAPTVILDAGGGFTSSSWAWVQPEIAETTRVCAYDRAGWGWSDPSLHGYSAVQNAAELRTLLANAGVPGPYILVGHSLGGLYVRVYAQQYQASVIGMVQLDASHPDAWRRLGLREGAAADPTLLAMGPTASRFGLLRLIAFTPIDTDLPERQQQEMRAFFATTQFAESALAFDRAFPTILEDARHITGLDDIPLAVLTLGEVDTAETDEAVNLKGMQLELAALSADSIYRAVPGATQNGLVHHRETAQASIQAILDVINAVRRGQPLSG
jgi:pimeloyl-ACP methyl ester carboxylesterase